MHKRLMSFLENSKSLYPLQFGFRSKHSTDTALLYCINKITKAIDNGKFACSIFIDLKKAFDTVDHEILLSKLDFYGVLGKVNSWFRSFLSNRSQFVSISNTNSKSKHMLYGVPKALFLDHCSFYCMSMIFILLFPTLKLTYLQTILCFFRRFFTKTYCKTC